MCFLLIRNRCPSYVTPFVNAKQKCIKTNHRFSFIDLSFIEGACYGFHVTQPRSMTFRRSNRDQIGQQGLKMAHRIKERYARSWCCQKKSYGIKTSRLLKHLIILMHLVNLKVILEKHGKPLATLLPFAPTVQRWKNWSWMVPLFLILASFLMLLMIIFQQLGPALPMKVHQMIIMMI